MVFHEYTSQRFVVFTMFKLSSLLTDFCIARNTLTAQSTSWMIKAINGSKQPGCTAGDLVFHFAGA
jgi:hypothetical protein